MNRTMRDDAGHGFEISTAYDSGLQDQLTVLVVSANLGNRRAVSRILEALSVQVVPCSSPAQMEQVLMLQRPNLIFCDERLPDGNYADPLALELPSEIRHRLSYLPEMGNGISTWMRRAPEHLI